MLWEVSAKLNSVFGSYFYMGWRGPYGDALCYAVVRIVQLFCRIFVCLMGFFLIMLMPSWTNRNRHRGEQRWRESEPYDEAADQVQTHQGGHLHREKDSRGAVQPVFAAQPGA